MRFLVPPVWKSKWPIAVATVLAAAVTFALAMSSGTDIWSGRAILTVGLAPASDFIALKSGSAVAPIENPRRTIARLSDPGFKEMIVKHATFQPASASISRSMVASSLRGIELDKERDIAIELSAGSAADVRSAFRVIAADIVARHAEIRDRQLDVVQKRIDGDKSRISMIENEIRELNERALQADPTPKADGPPHSPVIPVIVTNLLTWNELQNRVRDDTALKQLGEPTALLVDADNLVVTRRSMDSLRASLLTGAAMLVAMIILTIVVNPWGQGDGRLGRAGQTER